MNPNMGLSVWQGIKPAQDYVPPAETPGLAWVRQRLGLKSQREK